MSPLPPRTGKSSAFASSSSKQPTISSLLATAPTERTTATSTVQTLDNSLKRIRLNDTRIDSNAVGSVESDREWIQDEDEDDDDDMDDFAVSSTTVTFSSTSTTAAATTVPSNLIMSATKSEAAAATSVDGSSVISISKSTKPKLTKPPRSNNGMEDVFTHEQVKTWSEVRIKTWHHHPTEGQQNGAWGKKSQQEFLERLGEWKARGIRIGTSWGVFSMGVSHKAGYQCSSYYRKLLENKTLTDPAFAWENGKLVMVQKSSGGEMAISGLSTRWDTEDVKEIEANIDGWIKEYHSNGASRPASKAKRVDSTLASGSGSTSTITTGARSTSGVFRATVEAPRVKATTAPAVSKALSLRPSKQPIDESEMIPVVDIDDKLAEYSSFMKKSTSTSGGPNKIRQTISLTVPGTVHTAATTPARGVVSIEVRKSPLSTQTAKGQTGLSLFWKNIRPARIECPETLISKYIIPKDVELRPTWAHRIQSVTDLDDDESVVAGAIHTEVNTMAEFDWKSLSKHFDDPVNDIQGIMADPPWNFIVEDGRNDGACRLTTKAFGDIMENALDLMPSGIVCVWTHKAILPEVVSIMHGLGCRYVENLVWYKIALNNANLDRASPYFRTSKEILLMFKKGDGFDIRHQRTADVIMDFEKPTSSWIEEDYTEPKPTAVYEMMEIMLPDARLMPEIGRGRLLEIWAKKDPEHRRSGWFSVHELKSSTPIPMMEVIDENKKEERRKKRVAIAKERGDDGWHEAQDTMEGTGIIEIGDDNSDDKSDDLDVLLRDSADFEEDSLQDIEMET
ncbi:hypothetical protein BG004_000566 [Podila humilis]|nr:hypothetical protein BG004_000566 [Podila humilis]